MMGCDAFRAIAIPDRGNPAGRAGGTVFGGWRILTGSGTLTRELDTLQQVTALSLLKFDAIRLRLSIRHCVSRRRLDTSVRRDSGSAARHEAQLMGACRPFRRM